jgi:hypothetical protein
MRARPPKLPGEFQRAFDREKAKADLKYATRGANLGDQFLPGLSRLIRVQKVFFAYCTQARNAVRSGVWTVSDVTAAVEEAWPIICDGYIDRELAGTNDEVRNVRTAFWRTVEDDHQWHQHLTELLSISESTQEGTQEKAVPDEFLAPSTGMPSHKPPTVPARDSKMTIEWEQIEVLVEEHDARIRVQGGRQKILNYKEIPGFEDRRTGKPNQRWAMLRVFAGLPDGIMPDTARDGKEWEAIQKTIERMSAALRKHFGLTGDPFPYCEGIGYRARIKISSPDPVV